MIKGFLYSRIPFIFALSKQNKHDDQTPIYIKYSLQPLLLHEGLPHHGHLKYFKH